MLNTIYEDTSDITFEDTSDYEWDDTFGTIPHYALGPTWPLAVSLYPEYDLWIGKRQRRTDTRAKFGNLRTYKWYEQDKIEFSLNWLCASYASLINSWWDTNTKLQFYITSNNGPAEVHSLMLMNENEPLVAHNKPYIEYYRGEIRLEGY